MAVMSPWVEVVCLALVCGPVAGAEGAVQGGGEDVLRRISAQMDRVLGL